MPVSYGASDSFEGLLDDLTKPGEGPPSGRPADQGPHPQADDVPTTEQQDPPPRVGADDVPPVQPTGTTVSYVGGSYGGYPSSEPPSRFDKLVYAGEDLYFQLWGQYPAPGYVKSLVKQGLNLFEIEEHERRKPAFKKTKTYTDEFAALAQMVGQIMGKR